MAGMVGEEEDPLWKKILLNELLLVFVAAIIILWIAFALATPKKEAEDGKSRRNVPGQK